MVGVAGACGREAWRAGVAPELRGDAPVLTAIWAPAALQPLRASGPEPEVRRLRHKQRKGR